MDWVLLLEGLYFFLPAGIANIAPVLSKKIPFLNSPIDRGMQYQGKRIFGKNKTWRGLVAATLMGLFIASIQRLIGIDLSFFSYESYNFLLIGFLMGFGAILGDLIKSFFKRRVDKKSGESWVPWDQLDYIFGGIVFISFYVWIGWSIILIIFFEYFLLHLLFGLIGYYLKLKNVKI